MADDDGAGVDLVAHRLGPGGTLPFGPAQGGGALRSRHLPRGMAEGKGPGLSPAVLSQGFFLEGEALCAQTLSQGTGSGLERAMWLDEEDGALWARPVQKRPWDLSVAAENPGVWYLACAAPTARA